MEATTIRVGDLVELSYSAPQALPPVLGIVIGCALIEGEPHCRIRWHSTSVPIGWWPAFGLTVISENKPLRDEQNKPLGDEENESR